MTTLFIITLIALVILTIVYFNQRSTIQKQDDSIKDCARSYSSSQLEKHRLKDENDNLIRNLASCRKEKEELNSRFEAEQGVLKGKTKPGADMKVEAEVVKAKTYQNVSTNLQDGNIRFVILEEGQEPTVLRNNTVSVKIVKGKLAESYIMKRGGGSNEKVKVFIQAKL